MKNERNTFMPQMPFPGFNNMPSNMMMFPNYMNDSCSNLDNRISRLENPYQNNNQNYQAPQSNTQNNIPYQTTQNNGNYNGEMYMM